MWLGNSKQIDSACGLAVDDIVGLAFFGFDVNVERSDSFSCAPTAHIQSPDAIQSVSGGLDDVRGNVGSVGNHGTVGNQETVENREALGEHSTTARAIQKVQPLITQTLKTGKPASQDRRRQRGQTSRHRIRVASYCRVSTWHEVQVDSVRAQEAYYRRTISANPEWELAGIYIEIGVTGTRADTRPQLQSLLAECRKGRVDLILVKSISRFARNVTDTLKMIRELTSLGIVIRFEEERINTGTAVSEFMISIMAVFAEEESHSISGNVKWGVRQRFREGKYRPARDLYGYSVPRHAIDIASSCSTVDNDAGTAVGNDISVTGESMENDSTETVENSSPGTGGKSETGELREPREPGELAIIYNEATVVREVYGMVLSGIGTATVAGSLNRRGIMTRDGFKWTAARVAVLISNPAYRGDRLYQRTYKDENFRQRKNRGSLPLYYDEGCHIGIVSREVYDAAQGVVAQHRHENGNARVEEDQVRAGKTNTRYGFSGRLFCKHCGSVMRRKMTSRYASYACVKHRRPSCATDCIAADSNAAGKEGRPGSNATGKAGRPGSNAAGKAGRPGSNAAGKARYTHPTVRVQEDSIKAAFLTVLNKLAYSEKQRKQHRVVSRYIEMLSTPKPDFASVENRRECESDTAALEAELNSVRHEAARLAAVTQAEGFSARSIELSNELKDREQWILRKMKGADTICRSDGAHASNGTGGTGIVQAAMELRSFIRKWNVTSDLAGYRDKLFLQFVEKAVVGRARPTGSSADSAEGMRGELDETEQAKTYTITFYFKCGLILTEEVGA